MHSKNFFKGRRKGNNTVFFALSFIDFDLTTLKINLSQLNIDKLVDPDTRIDKCFDNHHVLKILCLPNHFIQVKTINRLTPFVHNKLRKSLLSQATLPMLIRTA